MTNAIAAAPASSIGRYPLKIAAGGIGIDNGSDERRRHGGGR
jgi:hypothetical protein